MAAKGTAREWDYADTAHVKCPICGQRWDDAPPVFIDEEEGLALVDGHSFHINDEQARLLQVLRRSYGRWLKPDAALELCYSDVPDADQPTNPKFLSSVVLSLRKHLEPTGFCIEGRRDRGYRFIRRTEAKPVEEPKVKKHNRVRRGPFGRDITYAWAAR